MSYPQFNLTTLQLPAPASSMTKAEYKAAYGIDLDEVNIKAFKLVLLGNEKYPIDQIKAVEDGFEIYFNGHVLSITNTIETLNNVYDVANAKPIYWHTCKFQRGGSVDTPTHARIMGYMIILTNSSNPITLDDFIEMLNIPGFIGVVINGKGSNTAKADLTDMDTLVSLKYGSENIATATIRNDVTNEESTIGVSSDSGWVLFQDLGANKIN